MMKSKVLNFSHFIFFIAQKNIAISNNSSVYTTAHQKQDTITTFYDEILKIIQKDLIDEFIIYVNKNFYPIKSTIGPSIYETNNFLLKNEDVTLIEYEVFCCQFTILKRMALNQNHHSTFMQFMAKILILFILLIKNNCFLIV